MVVKIMGRALMLSALLASPVMAQQAPAETPAAPAAAAPAGPPPEWVKVCGKDEKNSADVCAVNSYALAEAGNVIADVRVVEVKSKGESKRVFEAIIPVGFLVQPGVNLVIDQNKPVAGRYKVCFPNGCLVEAAVTDEFLASLKKGTNLVLFAANPAGQWVGAKIALSGFSKAMEGAAVDPKVYEEKRKKFEENQNKLQTELMKRAEEQRKQMQQQAGQGGTPAPAAPGKPAQ